MVSHGKALLSSLGATVGIGNIAGVGTAIHLGGPGALFWMWVSAGFGMFFRMVATYMAIKLRPDEESPSFATPMVYLERFMTGPWTFIPKVVAGLMLAMGVVLYNMVQANSLTQAVHNRFGTSVLLVALVLTFCVAVVIMGGLTKIVDYCSILAPIVISLYVLAGILVLVSHPFQTAASLASVIACAFSPSSVLGGVAGYSIWEAMQFGVSRGVFSHMSGMGTSTFLQAANKDEPAIGAFMSAITPFVDTVIICSITGLVILSVPHWRMLTGAHLAATAFEAGLGSLGLVVIFLSIVVFAYTTIAAFAHIGERCFRYLGGVNLDYFRVGFLFVTFVGPFLNLTFVWSLSDVLIGMMILFHLVPLLFICLSHRDEICRDLAELQFESATTKFLQQ